MSLHHESSLWDLNPILSLLQRFEALSFKESASTPTAAATSSVNSASQDENIPSLGNFDAVFKYLGKPRNIPLKAPLHDYSVHVLSSGSSPCCSQSTSASTPPDDAVDFSDYVKKEVRWSAEVVDTPKQKGSPTKQAKSGHSRKLSPPNKRYSPTLSPSSHHGSNYATIETESEGESPRTHTLPLNVLSSKKLIPSWVDLPHQILKETIPPDVPLVQLNRQIIAPIFTLTKVEKKAKLAKKLLQDFASIPGSSLNFSHAIATEQTGGKVSPTGIHVFVDASNIIIGFQNALKLARGMHKNAYIKRPPFAFSHFALIMERTRHVARRVLCGSVHQSSLSDYMIEARECGYEVSALERVEKMRETSAPPKRRTGRNGYQSSGSEAPYILPAITKGEQGVDEILHMKILESIIDYDIPSTMVLATGDAAEAEYSGGFLVTVERALKKGWKVELVSWRENMAYAWREKEFMKRWKGRFSIIELDTYSEELLAEYAVCKPATYEVDAAQLSEHEQELL